MTENIEEMRKLLSEAIIANNALHNEIHRIRDLAADANRCMGTFWAESPTIFEGLIHLEAAQACIELMRVPPVES